MKDPEHAVDEYCEQLHAALDKDQGHTLDTRDHAAPVRREVALVLKEIDR